MNDRYNNLYQHTEEADGQIDNGEEHIEDRYSWQQ